MPIAEEINTKWGRKKKIENFWHGDTYSKSRIKRRLPNWESELTPRHVKKGGCWGRGQDRRREMKEKFT